MSLSEPTPKQQWNELVKNSKSILLLTHQNPDGDAVGSILGLRLGLLRLGKQVSIAAAGIAADATHFLPEHQALDELPSFQKELLLILDESQAKIGNISLKRISDHKLIVVVTPKDGLLTANNVRIEEGSFNYDLIVCLDVNNLERLGSIYEDNANLFYEIPVVNIDHHSDNTNYGKVNIVDLTASSTAEILVSLLETVGKDVEGGIIDSDIATCLLTGITTDTGSFQNSNTTPKSLTIAAQLVAAGGRQQEIIRHIFKTKSLSTLRLWGRALSYLKDEPEHQFIWSVLTKADFVAAQAANEESSGVIDELLKTAQDKLFVLLLTEKNNGLHGSFRSIEPSFNVAELAGLFAGGGHPAAAGFFLPGVTLKDKESEILSKIRESLRRRLSQKLEPNLPPDSMFDQNPPSSTPPRLDKTPRANLSETNQRTKPEQDQVSKNSLNQNMEPLDAELPVDEGDTNLEQDLDFEQSFSIPEPRDLPRGVRS